MNSTRACLLVAGAVLGAGPLFAQSQSSLQSYQRARQVLNASIEAMGGLDKLRGINAVLVRHEGQGYLRNQSPRAAPPWVTSPTSGLLAYDLRGGRLLWDNAVTFPSGSGFNRDQLVITPGEGWNVDLVDRSRSIVPNPSIDNFRNFLRRLPHYLVLEALDRPAQLRSLGDGDYNGRRQEVVSFATADGQVFTLFFDAATHLLTKYEQVYTDRQVGDALLEVIWPSYRLQEGVQVPTGRQLRRVNEDAEQVRFTEFAINRSLPDSMFQRPAGYTEEPASPPADTTVLKLAEDVYVVRGVAGGNNSLFVAFSDHVLVVEAYGNDAASRRTIAKIKETIPGKPIRYLVSTHHHDDHIGGVRAFIAEGATIVTTPGNREYFERLSRGTFTLQPDALTQNPRPLELAMVSGKRRVFRDATHEVQVIDLGPIPHAEEMLVVYLPREGILVEGDLLSVPVNRIRPRSPTGIRFAEWLAQSGLDVKTLVPVHGPIPTPAQLQEALDFLRSGAGDRNGRSN